MNGGPNNSHRPSYRCLCLTRPTAKQQPNPLLFYDQHDVEVIERRQAVAKAVVDLCDRFLKHSDHIVDVLAGSGIIGAQLFARGFHNLHAFETCPRFQQLLQKRDHYRGFLQGPLKSWNGRTKFNAAVLYCSLAPGHLSANDLDDIVKAVVKGGTIIIGIRDLWTHDSVHRLYNWDCKLSEKMADLESNLSWELCYEDSQRDFVGGGTALFYVYKVS